MRRVACCLVAALVCVTPYRADAGLMCGRTVVLPGATSREVLDKCGAPTRRQSLEGRPLGARGAGKKGGGGREVWVYDLGSRQLVRYLTFDRGRLRAIDFGGYGR